MLINCLGSANILCLPNKKKITVDLYGYNISYNKFYELYSPWWSSSIAINITNSTNYNTSNSVLYFNFYSYILIPF